MTKLAGKTAIVTGAAQGLGFAIAERFVNEGAQVVLADNNVEAVTAAADRLGQVAIEVDVSRKADIKRMVDFTVDTFGTIDILVNNAGIIRNAKLLDIADADFDLVLAVNLKSVLFGIQAVTPHMRKNGRGAIINMASLAGVLSAEATLSYSVSKAGVIQMTNAAAIELARYGIRVNAIGPGTFSTAMAHSVFDNEHARARMLSRTPMGRPGLPEEAASVALFLAGEDSSYVTGKTIFVDGGRLGLNLTVDWHGDN